jgi:probable rRNA maturation factor
MPRSISVECDPRKLLSRSSCDNLRFVLERAAEVIEGEEDVTFGVVTVLVVDIERISALHEQFFGDPEPTDIITFPYLAADCIPVAIDGDIAICLEVVCEQANENGHSTADELAFVGVHGLLHLAGWTDEADSQRTAMHWRQIEILKASEPSDAS